MNKQKFKFLLMILVLFFVVNPLFAQRRITIRLASLVPENTAWGQALNRMAAEWARATNNEVQVIVFHGGTAGDEPEVLTKLRTNQLQAAVFSSMGLNSIMPEVMAISYPFLIRNQAEYNEVMRVLKPDLDRRIQQNGFTTLVWVHAGWIRFFSKNPVPTPADLRRVKIGSGTDDAQMINAFRIMGYQVESVPVTDSLMALNSGRIDAVYNSPVFVAGNQLFGVARNMSGINLAPFMGGILMNNNAWRQIPERYRPQLLEICRRLEREIEASVNALETEAITVMRRNGLIVNELTPAQMQVWYDDTARFENNLVSASNPVFHREYYFRIKDILTDFRRGR